MQAVHSAAKKSMNQDPDAYGCGNQMVLDLTFDIPGKDVGEQVGPERLPTPLRQSNTAGASKELRTVMSPVLDADKLRHSRTQLAPL